MVISVENRQFSHPREFKLTPPLKGFALEFGTGARVKKTRMMALPDGRKSFQIGLVV